MGTTPEQLELEIARAELTKAVVDADISRMQLRNQQRQMHVQMAVALIGLFTALATAYVTLGVRNKGEADRRSAVLAVSAISSAQQRQYQQVEDLRAFTLEVASAEPVVLVVHGDAGIPPIQSARPPVRPPPRQAPPPPIRME